MPNPYSLEDFHSRAHCSAAKYHVLTTLITSLTPRPFPTALITAVDHAAAATSTSTSQAQFQLLKTSSMPCTTLRIHPPQASPPALKPESEPVSAS
jgi:hypothetical protein